MSHLEHHLVLTCLSCTREERWTGGDGLAPLVDWTCRDCGTCVAPAIRMIEVVVEPVVRGLPLTPRVAVAVPDAWMTAAREAARLAVPRVLVA